MNIYQQMKFNTPQRKRGGAWYKCETCGKEFYCMPWRVKNANPRFCSQQCYDATKCGEGNPYWGKRHSPESINKMKQHPNRPSFGKGKDNPNFLRFQDYIPKSMQNAVKYKRDMVNHCERCGYSEMPQIFQVHHKDYNRKNNTQDNLIILCPNCHFTLHFLSQTGTFHNHKSNGNHPKERNHLGQT